MKSRTWMWMTVVSLFAALAMPVGMAAQDNPSQDHKSKHHKYKLYDVGTFGGLGSNFAESQALFNKSGTLVGYAETAIPDPYSPNCFDQDCLVAHGFQFRDGVLTDLGSLPGLNNSVAESLNDYGLVVGGSDNGLIDPLLGIPQAGAVGWKNGEIFSLGTLGGYQGFALAVNNSGQATGVVTNAIPDQYSFLGGTQSRAFLWQDGVMQDLGTLGGPDSFGQFNNDRGQVAGFSYTSSMPGPSGVPPFDPFIWERGKGIKDLGNFGGTACNPFYFNNRGELVGSMNLAGDQAADPFLWDGHRLIDLGGFGGSFGQGNWVNEAGDVAGFGYYSDEQTAHGALWAQGKKIKDLGTLAGDRCSDAWGINSTGQIVGVSWAQQGLCNYPSATITAQHAVIWENGSIVDLNTRIASGNSSLQLVLALEINDRGEIAGFGVPPGVPLQDFEFHGHVFVLVPCDENSPGDCDTGPASTVATTNNSAQPIPNAELANGAQNQLRNPPVSPVEHFRSQARQRYHLPGQPAAPRD